MAGVERVEIGPHVLYLGDCREILPTLSGIDAVVTDPVWPNAPSGMFPGIKDPERLFGEIVDALPEGVRQLVVCLRNDSDPRFLRSIPDERFPFQQVAWMQYVMPGYLGRILGGNECAYVFGRPVKSQEGRRVIPSVAPKAQISDRQGNPHPCPRAVSHQEYLVKWFSDEGETVCDPCMGSGTAGKACIRIGGRRFIGIEVDRLWFDSACERVAREWADEQCRLPFAEPEPADVQPALFD